MHRDLKCVRTHLVIHTYVSDYTYGAIGHPDALCPRCCTELIHDLHWVFLPCLFYSAPIVTRFCSAEKRLCPLEQTVDPCRFHFSRLCDILL